MNAKSKRPREYRGERLQALTVYQAQLVDAIAARIFPATETPGAVEAGAVFYIDRALAGAYRAAMPRYRRGLNGLEKFTQKNFGRSFLSCSEDQQDSVLSDHESGTVEELSDSAGFFALLRAHALEGVFGEPSYGGNRDMIGWRLVGFPGQQFGYSDTYINKVVDVPPIAWEGLPKKSET